MFHTNKEIRPLSMADIAIFRPSPPPTVLKFHSHAHLAHAAHKPHACLEHISASHAQMCRTSHKKRAGGPKSLRFACKASEAQTDRNSGAFNAIFAGEIHRKALAERPFEPSHLRRRRARVSWQGAWALAQELRRQAACSAERTIHAPSFFDMLNIILRRKR